MVLDAYLRERAAGAGAMVINGLFLKMELPESAGAGAMVINVPIFVFTIITAATTRSQQYDLSMVGKNDVIV